MEKNKPNPIAEVFSYAHDKKLIGLSVFLAVIAVLSGLLPYFAASYLVIGLINKTLTINLVLLWGILAIGGYLLKTICLTFSSVCSHKMGYAVMAEIRTMLTQKLLRLSMGKATQRNAGEYKEILMDEVEHLEYPLAHMLPELTSHILGFAVTLLILTQTGTFWRSTPKALPRCRKVTRTPGKSWQTPIPRRTATSRMAALRWWKAVPSLPKPAIRC